ncbi:glycoside hydrolase family 15 protein [Desulfolucanica intricata]|uniref:glycoside hydrolase family 15 protein n=1 Tax=Desulfolucanica intricata TaxID=1285191 RepID=UPI00135207C8|nr:glycoside hydrolase family 15 protein [Desulfolucanica intricata]
MLVSFKADGKLSKLFWPHIDYGQHMGLFLSGINIVNDSSQTLWLGGDSWQSTQEYLGDTNIVSTKLTAPHNNLEVVQMDLVLPEHDVLARHYKIRNNHSQAREMSFLTYTLFEIEESNQYDTAYFDFDIPAMVHFRKDIFFALAADRRYRIAGYQCGRKNTPADPITAAANGNLNGELNGIREAAGALAWKLGTLGPEEEKEITLYLACAHNRDSLAKLMHKIQGKEWQHWFTKTRKYWESWLTPSKVVNSKVDNFALYKRSILTTKLLCDKETGGIIAAPEFDPHYSSCGGYGYSWGRDGAIIAAALDEAGYHETARAYYMYAMHIQEKDGTWHQRHYMDGAWASTWGKQLDQGASILWGYRHHYTLTKEQDFLDTIWPSVVLAADYLAAHLSEENGLPEHSVDLWEEELSQNTYTAASVCGGLLAAADLARTKNEDAYAVKWLESARKVREGILLFQWSQKLNRFYRSINPEIPYNRYQQIINQGQRALATTDKIGLYPKYFGGYNDRVDASILGLSFPYRIISPHDPKMAASAQAVEEHLTNRNVGGIHRYQWDNYAGGNPWIITTLWLALYHCQTGNFNRARELYNWCASHANPNGLLPEQVDNTGGGPAWVLPLTWSHAMFMFTHLALQGKLSLIQ